MSDFLPIEKLRGWSKNPRGIKKLDYERLKRQVQRHGQFKPLIVTEDGEVIGGNMRLKVYQDLGIKEAWVSIVSVKDETEKVAIALADNDRAGYYEEEYLAELLMSVPDLVLEDYHLDLGKTLSAKDLLDKFRPTEEDDFDVEAELPDEPVSKLGDVYQLGNHRLMCGDSTDADSVTSLLDAITPHLMVTDPPYGVEYDANWRNERERIDGTPVGGSAIGKVSNDDRDDWREAWALFPGDVAYVWHAAIHSSEVAESLVVSGFNIRSQIIWAKSNLAISRGDYHWMHEPCWYAVRKGATGHWSGDRKQTTLWQIDKTIKSETGHSTQKPIECMARPLKNNSKEKDSIYDPFGGSGTTLIACEQLGRKCYMMELDPRYCDVIVKRWEQLTGNKAELVTVN